MCLGTQWRSGDTAVTAMAFDGVSYSIGGDGVVMVSSRSSVVPRCELQGRDVQLKKEELEQMPQIVQQAAVAHGAKAPAQVCGVVS